MLVRLPAEAEEILGFKEIIIVNVNQRELDTENGGVMVITQNF